MRIALALLITLSLSGCAFMGMAAAGFMGTVTGNLMSDFIEGKIPPKADAKSEAQR